MASLRYLNCDMSASEEKKHVEEVDFNHPAFINEDVDPLNMSPAMEALQQLKYESDNPRDDALQYKEEGNYHFARGNYALANENYTTALRKRVDDPELQAQLYTNRAISHFKLKNYRSSLNDAVFALQWKPNHLKGHVRAAHAAFCLKRWSECRQHVENGLKVSPALKELLELRQQLDVKEAEDTARSASAQSKENSALEQRTKYYFAVKERGVVVQSGGTGAFNIPAMGFDFEMSEDGRCLWPVLLFYPEFGQTDYLQHNEESVTVGDLVRMVLDPNQPPPAWDPERTYVYGQDIKIYYEVPVERKYSDADEEGDFFLIPHSTRLEDLLLKYKFPVSSELIVPLHVVSSASAFYSTWLKDRTIRKLEKFVANASE